MPRMEAENEKLWQWNESLQDKLIKANDQYHEDKRNQMEITITAMSTYSRRKPIEGFETS